MGWEDIGVYGINDAGVVVGEGKDGDVYKGFSYAGGKYTELLPPGWASCCAYGINNEGLVVGGQYMYSDGMGKAFVYGGGRYVELLPPGWETASAFNINENGVIVGWGTEGLKQKGFIATPVTTPK